MSRSSVGTARLLAVGTAQVAAHHAAHRLRIGRLEAAPETQEFFDKLSGFIQARDKLEAVALEAMPTKTATTLDDFSSDPLQTVEGSTEEVLEALYARAPAAKEALDAFCRAALVELREDPDREMLRFHEKGEERGVLRAYSPGPLKRRARCVEKVVSEYDGDARRLLDVVRGSVVFEDEARLVAFMRLLTSNADTVRLKNRFKAPTFNGYRDALFNLRVNGMICEVQVHLVQMLRFKSETHVFYEYFRAYFKGELDVVAERMTLLESIFEAGECGETVAVAVRAAVDSRDGARLECFADLLNKLSELRLLEVVRRRLLEMAIEDCGADSEEHGAHLAKMASVLQRQGRYEEALRLYRRTLEIQEARFGAGHPVLAGTLNDLAGLYQDRGQSDLALETYQRSLNETRGDDATVATTLNDLGLLMKHRGKLEEALPLYERALSMRLTLLGHESSEVATTLANLAAALRAQGELEQAEPMYRQALQIEEKQLGPDHPDVASILNNLAELLKASGKLEEALTLYSRSLEIRESRLGLRHPKVATSLNNLAGFLQAQDKKAESLPLLQRALSIEEEQLGCEHLTVASTLTNLACLLRSLDDNDTARPMFQRALLIFEKEKHPCLPSALCNVADDHQGREEFKEAAELYARALDLLQDDDAALATLQSLAGVLQAQGRTEEAVPHYRAALWLQPASSAAMIDLGTALHSLNAENAEIDALYRQALDLNKQRFGHDHAEVAAVLNATGRLAYDRGRFDDALGHYTTALKINENSSQELAVAATLENLATLHLDLGTPTKARPLLERALRIYTANLGLDHPDTLNAAALMKELPQAAGTSAASDVNSFSNRPQ